MGTSQLPNPDGAGAPGLLVEKAGWGGFASSVHVAGSSPRTVESFHSSHGSEAAPGTRRGQRETLRLKGFQAEWAIQDLNL
jgi:hypothetical protein